jgi:hypothetical protein
MTSYQTVPCLIDIIYSLFLNMKLVSEEYGEFVMLCSKVFVISEQEKLLCKK